MRAMGTADQLKAVYAALKGARKNTDGMWQKRLSHFTTCLHSGDLYQIATVIRDTHREDGMTGLSPSELDLHNRAFEFLLPEVAGILGKSLTEALAQLCSETGKHFNYDPNALSHSGVIHTPLRGSRKKAPPQPVDTTPAPKPVSKKVPASARKKPGPKPKKDKVAAPLTKLELTARVRELEREQREMASVLSVRNAEIVTLRGEGSAAQTTIGDLKNQVTELTRSHEIDKRLESELQHELSELRITNEGVVGRLSIELTTAKADRDKLDLELATHKSDHATEVNELKGQLATAALTEKDLREQIAQLEARPTPVVKTNTKKPAAKPTAVKVTAPKSKMEKQNDGFLWNPAWDKK
jgi:predicted  nucleic acid-binding Zn-ribbon protein